MNNIFLSLETINAISLHQYEIKYKIKEDIHIWPLNSDAGDMHYKLYAYISTLFNNIKIADVGTESGSSALALSYNNSNHVDSYEVSEEWYNRCCKYRQKENVTYFLEDVLVSDKLLNYDIIALDVNPHDGIKEKSCIDKLIKDNWNGILIMDDINWKTLRQLWQTIKLPKWDITKYGHKSGTGIVSFNKGLQINDTLHYTSS